MKREHFFYLFILGIVSSLIANTISDLGYTYRLANFLRENMDNLPIDVDDILKHN